MTSLTVIYSERESPFPPVYPLPLVCQLEFDHEFTEGTGVFGVAECYRDEILMRVAEARYSEFVGEMQKLKPYRARLEQEKRDTAIAEFAAGLELHFAFVGPGEVAMDWRDV